MPLNKIYTQSAEHLINFDFADILTDVGYVNFYGIDDEADNYRLSRLQIESTDVKSTRTGTSGNVERNFDFEFNISKKLKGDLYVTITIFADGYGSATAQNDTTIEIFHFDGSTETTIGTQQSITQLNNPSSTAQDEYRTTLTFAVDKLFKRGDKLRIEVISTITSSNANSTAGFYHDGANRGFSLTDQHGIAANSNLIIQLPFDLDI